MLCSEVAHLDMRESASRRWCAINGGRSLSNGWSVVGVQQLPFVEGEDGVGKREGGKKVEGKT